MSDQVVARPLRCTAMTVTTSRIWRCDLPAAHQDLHLAVIGRVECEWNDNTDPELRLAGDTDLQPAIADTAAGGAAAELVRTRTGVPTTDIVALWVLPVRIMVGRGSRATRASLLGELALASELHQWSCAMLDRHIQRCRSDRYSPAQIDRAVQRGATTFDVAHAELTAAGILP